MTATSAQYADATLRRCITTISRADQNRVQRIARQIDREAARASVPAPKPVAKPKVAKKPAPTGLNRPATNGQHARINRAEVALGYRKSPRSVLGTIGDAKAIWAGLKLDAAKAGIRLDAR